MFDLIAFDADDTLWHNELLYEQTQTRLTDLLSDYAAAETVVQQLYQTEMRNLEYYGYGIKSFTLSMIETAVEISQGTISGSQVEQIIGFAKEKFARILLSSAAVGAEKPPTNSIEITRI